MYNERLNIKKLRSEKMGDDMVSIVMLSHNGGRYVEETVRSVMAQTYTNWELLFVDDNSKDDTITKLMELKDKMVGFFCLHDFDYQTCANLWLKENEKFLNY